MLRKGHSEEQMMTALRQAEAGKKGLGYGDTEQLNHALEEVSRLLSAYTRAIRTPTPDIRLPTQNHRLARAPSRFGVLTLATTLGRTQVFAAWSFDARNKFAVPFASPKERRMARLTETGFERTRSSPMAMAARRAFTGGACEGSTGVRCGCVQLLRLTTATSPSVSIELPRS